MKTLTVTLPTSWDELTLEQYLKLIHLVPAINGDETIDDIDLNVTILSILLNVDEEILLQLPMSEMLSYVNAISFLSIAPTQGKSKHVMKLHTELTYDEFINFQKLKEAPFENMVAILSIFLKAKHTEDEILNMGMTDVFNSFHLLHQQTIKYLNSLQASLSLKLMKLLVKKKLKGLFKKKHS